MSDEHDDEAPDEAAILSRRTVLIAGALGGAASLPGSAAGQPMPCLSPRPPPSASFAPGPRRTVPLALVPAGVQAYLGPLTIYAAGGGLTSSPWRCVLDLRGNLSAGEGDAHGGSSLGPLTREWRARLPEEEVRALVALADRVWREDRPANRHPTADYDEVIALREYSEVFFLQGFGPLRGGAAEALITQLRAAARARRPPG